MGSDGLLAKGALSSFFFLDSIHIMEALIAYLREKDSMSVPGQSRRFRAAPEESGPPPITDIRCQRLTLTGLDLAVRRYRAPSISVAADRRRCSPYCQS
jgi:hypothetical protein